MHFSTWCLFGVLLQDHFLHLVFPCCYILSTHLSTRLLFNAGVSTRSSPMLLTLLRNSLAYVGGLFGVPSQTLDLAPPLLLSAYLICSPPAHKQLHNAASQKWMWSGRRKESEVKTVGWCQCGHRSTSQSHSLHQSKVRTITQQNKQRCGSGVRAQIRSCLCLCICIFSFSLYLSVFFVFVFSSLFLSFGGSLK